MIVNGIDISDCPFIDNDEKNCILGCLTDDCIYKQKKELEQENVNLDRENEILYKALKEIEEIVSEPCNIAEKTCKECESNCEHKDILNVINRVIG